MIQLSWQRLTVTQKRALKTWIANIVIILFLSTGQTVSTEVSKIIVNCKIYLIAL